MPLSPGHRLGPYEIVAPIGAGGMGDVYRAIDTRLGRTVAIKMLNGDHGERFQQEARAVAALNHPHICVLYDVGPDYAESFRCAEKSSAIAPWAPSANGVMAAALVNMDRATDAEPLLEILRRDPFVGPIGMAYHCLARGDIDGAVEWAHTAADQRVVSLVTILIRPFESRLRHAAGWPALLQKLNLVSAS